MGTKYQVLLNSLDALITHHGETNPSLRKDLETLRAQLVEAQKRRRAEDVARIGLQLVAWARWIFDHLPPPH